MSLGLEPVLTAHRTQAAKAHRQQENPGAHRTFQQFRRMRIPTTEMQFQYASVLDGNCIASFVYADMGYYIARPTSGCTLDGKALWTAPLLQVSGARIPR